MRRKSFAGALRVWAFARGGGADWHQQEESNLGLSAYQ